MDFKNSKSKDLTEYLTKYVDKNNNILVLGCGLSSDKSVGNSSIDNCIYYTVNFKNLTLSDYKYFYNPQKIHKFTEYEEYKEYFPLYAKEIEHTYKYSKNWFIVNLEERFLKLNLISDNIKSKLYKSYDYIELRWVLHFKEFSYIKRFLIIKSLLKKLNNDGIIGIQVYNEKVNKKYRHYNRLDLFLLKLVGKCEIFYDKNDGYSYITILLKKRNLL